MMVSQWEDVLNQAMNRHAQTQPACERTPTSHPNFQSPAPVPALELSVAGPSMSPGITTFAQGEEEDVFWGETNLVGREREPPKGVRWRVMLQAWKRGE